MLGKKGELQASNKLSKFGHWRKEKKSSTGLKLCLTAGQEVLDGNTLPSCKHTIPYSASHHMTRVTSITPDTILRAPLFILKERSFKLCVRDEGSLQKTPHQALSSGKTQSPPFDLSTYDNKLRSLECADLSHYVEFSSVKTPAALGIRTHRSQQAEPKFEHSH